MSLCAGTSNMDLAGDLVQSLGNYLGLEDQTADVSVCREGLVIWTWLVTWSSPWGTTLV